MGEWAREKGQSTQSTLKKERRERSDKKRSVNPYISLAVREQVASVARAMSIRKNRHVSLGYVAAALVQKMLFHESFFDALKPYMIRNFEFSSTRVLFGHLDAEPVNVEILEREERCRLPVRLSQPTHGRLCDLAYSLGVQWGPCAGLLLSCAFDYEAVVTKLDPSYSKGREEYVFKSYDRGGLLHGL
ncbi:hypothetical protein AV654_19610 [Paenibacillus elgii]|uniref:Uncharacterized protein n=1 Tax=Paenibacillus elgii TaxID=189691 RepID=A0A161SCM7_9BACL|nr:hypothetical protein [Paenibacillus elgii]KZE78185.1 hypothetical protein AV654_19610 [Paenibacillus elgii]